MPIFVDTSAFYALASRDDANHERVKALFGRLANANEILISSSYVMSETMGLLQHRLGWATLQRFVEDVTPLVTVIWVKEREHQAGWQLMLGSPARHFTIVDATAMVIMRQENLRSCATLDPEFRRQGFEILP